MYEAWGSYLTARGEEEPRPSPAPKPRPCASRVLQDRQGFQQSPQHPRSTRPLQEASSTLPNVTSGWRSATIPKTAMHSAALRLLTQRKP